MLYVSMSRAPSPPALVSRWLRVSVAALVCMAASGCGSGGDDGPPATENPLPAATAPQLTQQPAAVSLTAGQSANFTVAASGSAPLGYQWQRNGTDIAGATSASYALASAALSDSGAVFRVVVRNDAGSATSDAALLTVVAAAPVLTITAQPASLSVAAGTPASFSVGATCSAGSLQVQWQRLGAAAFADIAGSTSASYTLTPAIGDDGAQFRANLSCGGLSVASSGVATLAVTAPAGPVLTQLALAGLRNNADIRLLGGIVREPSGSYAFISASTIRRLSADFSSITLVAGSSTDSSLPVDGVGPAARFGEPRGITVDPAGNLYVVDMGAHTVRRIAVDGTVTTIAGRSMITGTADGTGAAARFNFPQAIAIGPDGDLYVADRANGSIRRVTPGGTVTTYAGATGVNTFADGPASVARFALPAGVAVAADGTVFVADAGNSRIRRILRSGGAAGFVETVVGGLSSTIPADGPAGSAVIVSPHAMTLDGSTLYVRDASRLLRAIDLSAGRVTTVVGNTTPLPPGLPSFGDGPRGTGLIDANFGGVAATGDGRLLLTDFTVGAVRLVDASGGLTTLAVGAAYHENIFDPAGVGVLSQQPVVFDNSRPALAAAPDGSILVATAQTIRRIAPDGRVTPVAGLFGAWGFRPGANSAAAFLGIGSMAARADGTIAVFDTAGVRLIAPDTHLTSSLAGLTVDIQSVAVDGIGAAARFGNATSVAWTPSGDILALDKLNFALRRITPAGVVTTFAGALGQAGSIDGPGGSARFQRPLNFAVAPDGTAWVADRAGNVSSLRKVAVDGSVTTLPLSGLELSPGTDLAFDPAGNLFVLSNGLYQIDTRTGAATLRIPANQNGTTLGSSPTLGPVDRIIALGVKQLAFEDVNSTPASPAGQLLRATVP